MNKITLNNNQKKIFSHLKIFISYFVFFFISLQKYLDIKFCVDYKQCPRAGRISTYKHTQIHFVFVR